MYKAFFGRHRLFYLLLLAAACAVSSTAIAAETHEDKLLSTSGTPDVFAKGQETDGYMLGILAYTWGYPLVRMEWVARSYTDVSSPQPPTSYRAPLKSESAGRCNLRHPTQRTCRPRTMTPTT